MPFPSDDEIEAAQQYWIELWKAQHPKQEHFFQVNPNEPVVLEAPGHWQPGVAQPMRRAFSSFIQKKPINDYQEALRQWKLRGITPYEPSPGYKKIGVEQKLDPRDVRFGPKDRIKPPTPEEVRLRQSQQQQKNIPLSETFLKKADKSVGGNINPPGYNALPYVSKIRVQGPNGKETIHYVPGLNKGHALQRLVKNLGSKYKYEVIDTFRNPSPVYDRVDTITSTGGWRQTPFDRIIGREASRIGELELGANAMSGVINSLQSPELKSPSKPWESGDVGRGMAMYEAARNIEKAKADQYLMSDTPSSVIDLAGENLRNRLYPPNWNERMPISPLEDILGRAMEYKRLYGEEK